MTSQQYDYVIAVCVLLRVGLRQIVDTWVSGGEATDSKSTFGVDENSSEAFHSAFTIAFAVGFTFTFVDVDDDFALKLFAPA